MTEPSKLSVFKYPSPVLNLIAREYNFSENSEDKLKYDISLLCHQLDGVMRKFDGLSIAATQCNIPLRIFVVNTDYLYRADGNTIPRSRFYINPEIVEKSEKKVRNKEGCLSYPKCTAWVFRHEHIKIEFQDETGTKKTEEGGGLFSIMAQHEIDHLDGRSLIDSVDIIEKDKLLKQIRKSAKKKIGN